MRARKLRQSRWASFAAIAALTINEAPSQASAEPVTDAFAASVQVAIRNGCALLTVQFHERAQYAGHFPQDRSDDLSIRLRPIDPIAIDAPPSRFPRQAVPVDGAEAIGVRAVTMEFDQAVGTTLRVQFARPVAYDVAQWGAFDAVIVAFAQPGSNATCRVAELMAQAVPGAEAAAALPRQRAGKISAAEMKALEASMDEARYAIQKKSFKEAIALLRKALAYPENAHTADALETFGEASRLAGDGEQANAAFKEYLRRYPNGDGAARVSRQLGDAAAAGAATSGAAAKDQTGDRRWFLTGGVSSFYVSDDSATVTKNIATAPNPNADPDSHVVHLNTILNNVDLYGGVEDEQTKTKFKLSGTFAQTLSAGGAERTLAGISSAYVETMLKSANVALRIGRQTDSGSGVIGRFDGAHVSWQATDSVRLSAVGGAADWSSYDAPLTGQRYLVGASVDIANFPSGADVSFFGIQQNDRLVLDRRAVGAEFRYFNSGVSAQGLVDYDVHFQTLNAADFSGSLTLPDKSVVSTALDYRRVPYLATWSALQGQPYLTLYDMLKYETLGDVRRLALDRTPTFKSAMISYSRPLNATWQIGGDATVTSMSGTPPSGGVDGTIPSGVEYYLSGQLTGANVFKPGDLYLGALRYAHLADSNVYFVDLSARYPWSDALQISPRLRAGYRQGTTTALKETTVLPSLLVDYSLSKSLSLEGEVGVKWIDSNAAGVLSNTKDYYFTLGVRSDFANEGVSHCAGLLAPCSLLWHGGPNAQQAKTEAVYYGGGAPAGDAAAPTAEPMISVEAGTRYWLGQGRNRYNYYADSTPTQVVSKLNYASNATNAGEAYFRADLRQGLLRNVFVKGMAGGGAIGGGKLFDEDLPPITTPYSKTVSDMSGRLGYWGLDLGYNVYTADRYRIGAFAGFQQVTGTWNAGGCAQLAGSPICAAPIPTFVRLVTEHDLWNSLRVGAALDVNLTDKLKWSSELALAAVRQQALDNHYATFGKDPARGRGAALQVESSLNYRLSDNWQIGAGARWWRFDTNAVDGFGQLLRYKTDSYGVFFQASYRFGWDGFSGK
jgi:tetratricopeptide (TPR) repeat protein